MATTKLMTAEEFALITDIGRFDLIDGELISMSPAGGYQGEIASQFVRALLNHSDEWQPGKVYTAEASFVLQRDPDVVLAPDAAFVRASRLPPLAERLGFLPVAIVSPSDRMTAVRRKVATYLALGTPLVVMIEPRHRRVTIFRAGREPRVQHVGDVIDGDDVMLGFELPVAKLFE
jgi:Uma2 family endonuclease